MRARLGETLLLLVAFVVLVGAGAASAGSNEGTLHAATSGALGTKILVDSRGFTLYHRLSEKKGSVSCIGACRKAWPPLLVTSGKPVAGTGLIGAKLGTIKRPDGGVQVTYTGYSLYLSSADKKAGQTNGQGAKGEWYAITPAGAVTKVVPQKRSTTTTTTTSTSSGGGDPSGSPPSSGTPTTGGTTTVDSIGCPPGQVIFQGVAAGSNNSDDDDDNEGGVDDGDGCV